MPKKKEEVPTAPLPPIDHAYVQALKIKDLEERNEALRQELQALKDERSQRHSDETDVLEHMQRDLRSKSSRIGELQRDLTETQKKLEEALSSNDQILTQQRELFRKQRESTAHELESLRHELNEVKVFQERRSVLEAELSELSKQVHALKTRHEVQVSDMKREFDLKYADVHTKCKAKVEEMEESVETRAMLRVDAVTKKTITTNSRQKNEIENLLREVDELMRNLERANKDKQALRFEVECKATMVEELERNMTVLKAQLNRHDKTIEDNKAAEAQWSEVSERGDKQTLLLQMMVKALQDRVAKQALQISHYQSRIQGRTCTARGTYDTLKAVKTSSPRLHPNKLENMSSHVYNFVGALPGKAVVGSGGGGGGGSGSGACVTTDWCAPLEHDSPATRRPAMYSVTRASTSTTARLPLARFQSSHAGGGGGSAEDVKMKWGTSLKVPPLIDVSKNDVAAMLLAAAGDEETRDLQKSLLSTLTSRDGLGQQRKAQTSVALTHR